MKVLKLNSISDYKKINNAIGITCNNVIVCIKNKLIHNDNFASIINIESNVKSFYFKNIFCFKNINNNMWIFFVKKINSKHKAVSSISSNLKYENNKFYPMTYLEKFNDTLIQDQYDTIVSFKNSYIHCETGPAVILRNNSSQFLFKNSFEFLFNGKFYGSDKNFTIKTWKKKVKQLKREEKLKIFI